MKERSDPAQDAARIDPPPRVYDLRHTFRNLRAPSGISTFDRSRYIGTRLTMTDRHYGQLAGDGRQQKSEALQLMARHQIRRLPVIENGRLVGMARGPTRRATRRGSAPAASRSTSR